MAFRPYALLLVFITGLGLFIACVSRTVFDQRFRDSATLTAPQFSGTLADPDNFSFAIVGDLHIGNADTGRLSRILTAAAAEGDAFFIPLGDITDSGIETDVVAYRTAVTAGGFDTKTFPVIGNHDIFQDGWETFKKYNGPSHYAFTAGNSKFIVLDTADGGLGDDERKWLTEELEKPAPAHLFLASHYLPTVPGQRTYLKLADDVEALDLMKLATDKKITAWLGAHYHSYLVGKVGGVDYVVAGGGGAKRMPPVLVNFFVQVTVAGSNVTYQMRQVN